MSIIRQAWITRNDLIDNRNRIYVFGDNINRTGYGGQAASMRGEPNAFGIPTKWSPSSNELDYFEDDDLDRSVLAIILSTSFVQLEEILRNGYDVVIPTDGLGTGLSKLPEKAPRIAAYIDAKIADLEQRYGAIVY